MRPDEEANRAEIERDSRFRRSVSGSLGTAAAVGAGASLSHITPFLNKFIPVDLAMKGLSKVSPKLADFLKRGQSMGLDVKEGLDYIKDGITQGEKSTTAKQDRNIIEQESPELHQFLDQEIKKGRNPIEAAALAQYDKRFKQIIQKLTKTHNTPWSSIIESVYGTGEMAQPSQQQTPMDQPMQGQQQMGPGMQAISAVLNKINQRLGG